LPPIETLRKTTSIDEVVANPNLSQVEAKVENSPEVTDDTIKNEEAKDE
jgi:hypothetical protein